MENICYVIWKFKSPENFVNMGGAENQLLKIIRQFKNSNKKIAIIARKTNNDKKTEIFSENITIYRINTTNIRYLSMIIFMFLMMIKIIKINKNRKIDIIHVPLPDLFIISLKIISKILKIPVINRIAADELYPKNKGGLWFVNRIIVRNFILKSEGIQVLNPTAKNYAKNLGYPENRIFLIPNGTKIPKKIREYKEFTFNLLYIGAMRYFPEKDKIEQKNLLFLIESFYELSKIDSHMKLILVGDGNFRTILEQRVKELDLQNITVFTGYQSDIYKYHLISDVFINPSWKEGMPNSVIEAMSSGMVAMCSDIPEHRFIIKDKENGILFNQKDKKDLLNKIIEIYNDKELCLKISKNARNFIKENLSIEKTIKSLNNMYKFYLKKK